MGKKLDYHGLSLVGGKDDRMASAPQVRPNRVAHIQRNGYIADIIVGSWSEGQIYHYVVQPAGSREIVHWGQETSLRRAQDCVEQYMGDREALEAL